SSSKSTPDVTSDTEYECNNQEPLPPLPKLSRADPIRTSSDVIPSADLIRTPSL
ncbi:hypothetical protein Tco_1347886, partial [Tanacetum coccineum]